MFVLHCKIKQKTRAAGGSGLLIEGAIMVLSVAVVFCIGGIMVNLWVRRRHDKQPDYRRRRHTPRPAGPQ